MTGWKLCLCFLVFCANLTSVCFVGDYLFNDSDFTDFVGPSTGLSGLQEMFNSLSAQVSAIKAEFPHPRAGLL